MITLIEALNFRCLRYIRQPLGPFHVLVGPNASGKTTFLDVPAFLGRIVSEGIDTAVSERAEMFHDLVWQRGTRLGLAVEAAIPSEITRASDDSRRDTIRYEMMLGTADEAGAPVIRQEFLWLLRKGHGSRPGKASGATEVGPPATILIEPRLGARPILHKLLTGPDMIRAEVGRGGFTRLMLGPRHSALANVPEDTTKFPAATWFRRLLVEDLQRVLLNSSQMKKASLVGPARRLNPDGSNLPLLVERLRKEAPARFKDWIAHLRTALPDLKDVRTVRLPENSHCWLMLHYRNGLAVPAWSASDGTLRLLALTLLAYMEDVKGLYLIEEPENGMHPLNIETVYQSLSSLYDAQALLATHSPVILSLVKPEEVLCFSKTPEGATDIVLGKDHPMLRDWRGQPNLSVLFASGVLG